MNAPLPRDGGIQIPVCHAMAGRAGFSLIEILIALAITVTALIVLVALLGRSADTTRRSQSETLAVFMASQIRTFLLADENWPPGTANRPLSDARDAEGFPTDSFAYSNLFFDATGQRLDSSQADKRAFQAVLTFRRSANYRSPRLDQITLELIELESRDSISGFTFQRARKKERPRS